MKFFGSMWAQDQLSTNIQALYGFGSGIQFQVIDWPSTVPDSTFVGRFRFGHEFFGPVGSSGLELWSIGLVCLGWYKSYWYNASVNQTTGQRLSSSLWSQSSSNWILVSFICSTETKRTNHKQEHLSPFIHKVQNRLVSVWFNSWWSGYIR